LEVRDETGAPEVEEKPVVEEVDVVLERACAAPEGKDGAGTPFGTPSIN
jgi:hypothetical protein